MNTGDTTSSPKSKARRLTRADVLWIIVGVCLAFWGVEVIDHSLQPQYQGKTAQEWFQSASFREINHVSLAEATNQPVVVAFKHLGPDAVHYLWQKNNRARSHIEDWLGDLQIRLTGQELDHHPKFDPMKAYSLLEHMGPAAEPIIPELIEQLLLEEPDYAALAAYLLGSIRTQPETVLPALVKSLTMKRHSLEDRQACVYALGAYGSAAVPYLPTLRAMLLDPHLSREEKVHIAAATLRISGEVKDLKQAVEEFFTLDPRVEQKDFSVLSHLEALGPLAQEIAPSLLAYSRTTPSVNASNYVINALQTIDPQGKYSKP